MAEQQQGDFPVPQDMDGFWMWDKMHRPRPVTPMTEEFWLPVVSEGFSTAMDEFACPVGLRYQTVNRYGYMTAYPFDLGTETPEDRVARYEQTMQEILPQIGALWEDEWLPSMLPGIEKGRTTDYGALSDDQLLETLEEMRSEFLHRYLVHGKINFVLIAASQFADFYLETFQPEDPTEPYAVLQGFPTRSVDAGRGLWQLGRTIKASPALSRAFAETETSHLVTGLEGSDEGRKFLDDLRIYLDEFGWRSDAFELSDPTWREDPTIPLNTLQGYMYLDDDADPELRFREAVEKRHELLDGARQRLAGEPEKLAQFDHLYDMARHYLPITENHNYYIDQVGNGIMRLPFLELGRRLVNRGALADANDVFYLYLDETRAGLSGTGGQAQVAECKAELDRWSKVVPVPTIGEPPEPHGDPLEAGIQKMFGAPPEPSRDPDVINGIGASQGTVQGTAKVVRSLSEASKLRQGDVMVCEMTMPPWTPLFSTVSAVVADTGGVLSHCAIVSREYRMPCVVGTIVGTAVIKDGMQLTVDGSQGIVRIESRS